MREVLKRKRGRRLLSIPPRTKLGRRIRDPFGNVILAKRILTTIIGAATYRRFSIVNKTDIEGFEYLADLPSSNVLFVSNHQTYFADVMILYHIFSRAKWGLKKTKSPIYLLTPRVKSYYIAAEETMKDGGWLPKVFSYAGAVLVKRSWRHKGKDVKRGSDFRAPSKVKQALADGWVITFPQGTTALNAPIRKGAASIIKSLNPIVVPVELDGFRKAFDKKGLRYRKKGVQLSVKFKKPIQFDANTSVAEIHQFLEANILKEEDSK